MSGLTLEQQLAQALHLQHQGDLASARNHFDALTETAPQFAEAHYFKGLLATSEQRFDDALRALGQAIQLNPNGAVFYGGLGTLYFHQERWEEAATAYEQGISIEPHHHELLNNLGTVYLQLDRPKDALRVFVQAAELMPALPILHLQMARALKEIDEYSEALACCNTAIALNPNDAEGYFLAGYLYHKLEEQRLQDPKQWMSEDSHTPQVIDAYLKGLALNPKDPQAYFNLGNAFKEVDRLEEALMCYEASLELEPTMALAWNNRGYVLRALGEFEEAEQSYQAALRLEPTLKEAHFNRAVLFFLQKALHKAWGEYEWRQARTTLTENIAQPLWQGEPLAGKTLLIRCEQGFGDTLQFIRFAQPLKAQGARLIIECQPGLGHLIYASHWLETETDMVIERSTLTALKQHAFDFHIPLMSLPFVMQCHTPETLQSAPYLCAPQEKAALWPARIQQLTQPGTQLKIGIVWSGSAHNQHGRHRSIDVDAFLPLQQVPQCQLFSLQVEADGRHTAPDYLQFLSEAGITPLAQHFEDFADTAGCIEALDMVISIDTAVAHLAGALGKPVWLLLPWVADWRWMNDTQQTPWYPHTQIFHQQADKQWLAVINRVLQALQTQLANH